MTGVSVHRLADLELIDAAAYYELESPGLGFSFLAEAELCLEGILKNPVAGVVLRGEIRRRLLRRFPYGLLYKIRPQEIRVLAVMNLKRRPWYWVGRA